MTKVTEIPTKPRKQTNIADRWWDLWVENKADWSLFLPRLGCDTHGFLVFIKLFISKSVEMPFRSKVKRLGQFSKLGCLSHTKNSLDFWIITDSFNSRQQRPSVEKHYTHFQQAYVKKWQPFKQNLVKIGFEKFGFVYDDRSQCYASHLGPLQFVVISQQFSPVLHSVSVYIFPKSESFLSYSISLCSSRVNFQQLHISVVSNPWLVVLFLVLELKTDATGRVSLKYRLEKLQRHTGHRALKKLRLTALKMVYDRVS